MSTLAEELDQLTVQGTLYESLSEGAVRCYACGHRCLIKPGRRGICKVRFNDNGVLKVPWGYVAALQSDPVEKKPFFHLYPGVDALTFGMLGCDFHCGYCFSGDTMVVTNRGPIPLSEAFALAERIDPQPDGEIGYPAGLKAVTDAGELHAVRAVFKHPYQGELVSIEPYYLPPLRCTPDHRVYATLDPETAPQPVYARELTLDHYLAVPAGRAAFAPQVIRPADWLCDHQVTYRVRWSRSLEDRELIRASSERGESSRETGLALVKSAAYIRHVQSKLARGAALDTNTAGPILDLDSSTLRFPNEHRPGIPLEIPLGEDMARLLGYYCAEGCVVQSSQRPNSLVLNFSFSHEETSRAEEVVRLLHKCLGVQGRLVTHATTLTVSASKASAALLFKTLAGSGAQARQVPEPLFTSPEAVVRAFLEAYIAGDGHSYPNGKVSSTTVSRKLAYGLGWLALQVGLFPSIYDTPMQAETLILSRRVKRGPHQFSVVWHEKPLRNRKIKRAGSYYLLPLDKITRQPFQGDVYNLEVEEKHNYLANFCLVSNCQNWLTSQAMRDPASDVSAEYVRRVTPQNLVDYAKRVGAGVVASSYNEPLITSEWAVAVFEEMHKAGLPCVFISNGNMTPEAIQYLRPHLVGYKIDLKTMQDKHYRQLGGVLNNVLDGIRMAHDQGLWVEIVTLIVPGFNDSPEELWDAARFISSVSPEIPWHVTAFHPDYKMTDPEPTGAKTLRQAAEIGQEAGLKFVYAGNLPGRVGNLEHTPCPNCGTLLIERYGYVLLSYTITAQGTCPKCGTTIPGIWSDQPQNVRLGGPGYPQRVFRDK